MTVWTEAFSSRDWMKTRGRATGGRFSHFLTANCLVLSLAGVSAFAQPSIDSFSVPNAVEEMGVVLATVSASGQNPLTYIWSFKPDPTGQALFFNSATAAYTKTISATSVIFGVGNPGPNPPSPSLEGQQFTVKVSVSDGTDTVVRTKQVTVSGSNQRPIITLATTGMGTQANPRVSPQALSLTANQSFDPDGEPVRFAWRLGAVSGGQPCPGKVLVVFGKETDRPSMPLPLVTARPQNPMRVNFVYRVIDAMYFLEDDVLGFAAAQNGCTEGGFSSGTSVGVPFGCESVGNQPAVATAPANHTILKGLQALGNGEEFYLDASDSTVPDGTQEEIDNLVFEWTQIAGTNAFAQGLDQKVVNVLVTDIMQEESLVFQVLVRNGSSLGSDVVQVPVQPQYIGGPDTGTSEVFFPITGFGPIGDGTSLETTLIIEDVGPEDVDDVTIEFYDGRGDPFDVGYRAAGASPQTVDIWDPETPFSILWHTSRIMEFLSATGQEISSGWARVRSSGRLRGSVRFQIVAGDGSLVQDVGIFAGNRGRRFQTPFRRKDEFAIAISNPGDSAALVDLFLFSNDAPDSPIEVVTQLIQPSGMQAFFLAERFPGDLPIDEGTLIVAVEGEAEVVVTGLITKDGFFISSQSISRIE